MDILSHLSSLSPQNCKQSLYQRQRNILYLIAQYLDDFGLKQSKVALLAEAHLTNDFKVCDNIDLDTIYLDYCSYYHLKFGKQPKIVKRLEASETAALPVPKGKSAKSKSVEVASKKSDADAKAATVDANKCEPATEASLCELIDVTPCFQALNIDKLPDVQHKRCTVFEHFSGELLDLAYTIETYVNPLILPFLVAGIVR